MNTKYKKYPRTFHVPWSKAITSDDKVRNDMDFFDGKEVVVTRKMDGENTTMYDDHIHARSIDSKYHPSRTWVKSLHSTIRFKLSENQSICGENMFWVHSIVYTDLPSYFLMFGFWEGDVCASWNDTLKIASDLELSMVSVLYRGVYDETLIKELHTEDMDSKHEGYVIRIADSFHRNDFTKCVAKYVREGHVQTDSHWMRTGGELNMVRVPKSR